MRRSTWALSVLFVAVLVLYLTVRPDDPPPAAPSPVPVFVVPTTTEPPSSTPPPTTTSPTTTSLPTTTVGPPSGTADVPVPSSSSGVDGPTTTVPSIDDPAPLVTDAG